MDQHRSNPNPSLRAHRSHAQAQRSPATRPTYNSPPNSNPCGNQAGPLEAKCYGLGKLGGGMLGWGDHGSGPWAKFI